MWKTKLRKKITIFISLVMRNRILTCENITKRGMVGPYRCFLCELEDETTIHLLDTCNFISTICDRGEEFFWRYDRIRQHLDKTIIKWTSNTSTNPVLNQLWEHFPHFVLWEVWREWNLRTFQGKSGYVSKVWDTITTKMRKTIRVGAWGDADWESNGEEALIIQSRGLTRPSQ